MTDEGHARHENLSANLRMEVGATDMPGRHEAFCEDVENATRACSVTVEYTEPFKKKPKIFLALSKIDVGGSKTGKIDRLRLRMEEEHTDGFRLVFETWNDSIVYNAAAFWIAVGD